MNMETVIPKETSRIDCITKEHKNKNLKVLSKFDRSKIKLFRGEITPLSSSYNISGLVPACWLLFQCF